MKRAGSATKLSSHSVHEVFLEAPPDVFHHDSSLPPPYSNPENHCNASDLSDCVEEDRGVGISFTSHPKLNRCPRLMPFLHTYDETICSAIIFSGWLDGLMLERMWSSAGTSPLPFHGIIGQTLGPSAGICIGSHLKRRLAWENSCGPMSRAKNPYPIQSFGFETCCFRTCHLQSQ